MMRFYISQKGTDDLPDISVGHCESSGYPIFSRELRIFWISNLGADDLPDNDISVVYPVFQLDLILLQVNHA